MKTQIVIYFPLLELSAMLQKDHSNQAKTKVQQLGLRQKSFAPGLATIPWLDLLQLVATGGILAMFASVLETMCTKTVTPWVHCPHGHCDHASPLHNEPSDQAHWFTSQPPDTVVSGNTTRHL